MDESKRFTPEEVRGVILNHLAEYEPTVTSQVDHFGVVCNGGRPCQFKVDYGEMNTNRLWDRDAEPRLRGLLVKRIDRIFGHSTYIAEKVAKQPPTAPPRPPIGGDVLNTEHLEKIMGLFERMDREHLEVLGRLAVLESQKPATPPPTCDAPVAKKRRGRPVGSKNVPKKENKS